MRRPPGVGRHVWTELLADDPDAESEFYRGVFGYEVRTIERRRGRYTMLVQRGVERAGRLRNPTGVPIGSHGYMSVGTGRWF